MAAVLRRIDAEPERLDEIAEDLLLMARSRDQHALRAIIALFDRLDGPITQRLELEGTGDVEFRVRFPKPAGLAKEETDDGEERETDD
jgi:hypothetical protein